MRAECAVGRAWLAGRRVGASFVVGTRAGLHTLPCMQYIRRYTSSTVVRIEGTSRTASTWYTATHHIHVACHTGGACAIAWHIGRDTDSAYGRGCSTVEAVQISTWFTFITGVVGVGSRGAYSLALAIC